MNLYFKTNTLLTALTGALILLFYSAGSFAQPSVSACLALFENSFKSSDLEQISKLLESQHADICPPPVLEHQRYQVVGVAARSADELIGRGEFGAARQLLEGMGAAKYNLNDHWMLNAVWGDLHAESTSWAEAHSQYSESYEKLIDLKLDPAKASRLPDNFEDLQAYIFKKTNEALMLTGKLSNTISRSGDASGTLGSRGPRPEPIPLPIQFEIDKATLLTEGEDSVRRLVAMIAKRNYSEIEFIGHTDWTGSNSHNDSLAKRRAQTVVEAVRRQWAGQSAQLPRILSRASGEDCPPQISDADRYTKTQVAALYRRVEIVLPPAKIGGSLNCGPKLYTQ